jgi:hypothetical protein
MQYLEFGTGKGTPTDWVVIQDGLGLLFIYLAKYGHHLGLARDLLALYCCYIHS